MSEHVKAMTEALEWTPNEPGKTMTFARSTVAGVVQEIHELRSRNQVLRAKMTRKDADIAGLRAEVRTEQTIRCNLEMRLREIERDEGAEPRQADAGRKLEGGD